MRFSVRHLSWLVLALASMPMLQGCDQKAKAAQNQTLAPPIEDAPPPKPATVSTADLPPPQVNQPAQQQAAAPPPKPAETPKKPAHKKKPDSASQQPVQQASNGSGTPASVSAIGELSSAASGDQRTETEDSINATEKGLTAITRSLNDTETKTAAQIREFLKQAREALNTGDVEGAANLAKKAKVLLAELNQ
jgi:hypothetical protein